MSKKLLTLILVSALCVIAFISSYFGLDINIDLNEYLNIL